jgi:hypothetical protein
VSRPQRPLILISYSNIYRHMCIINDFHSPRFKLWFKLRWVVIKTLFFLFERIIFAFAT